MVAIASGYHLFPFRTEKLSPSAPMVLQTRGRVGRRQLLDERTCICNKLRMQVFFVLFNHNKKSRQKPAGIFFVLKIDD